MSFLKGHYLWVSFFPLRFTLGMILTSFPNPQFEPFSFSLKFLPAKENDVDANAVVDLLHLLELQVSFVSSVGWANTEEETESHDDEAAPPLENLNWDLQPKVNHGVISWSIMGEGSLWTKKRIATNKWGSSNLKNC